MAATSLNIYAICAAAVLPSHVMNFLAICFCCLRIKKLVYNVNVVYLSMSQIVFALYCQNKLVEEAEQPERNDIVMTDLKVVDGIVVLRVVLRTNHPVADTEAVLAVHQELHVALVRFI